MRNFLFLLLSVIAAYAHATLEPYDHDYYVRNWSERVEIDGICYRFMNIKSANWGPYAIVTDFATPEETFEKYQGVISIPSKVIHDDVEYDVSLIYRHAFENCTNLSEVILSEGMETIYNHAFANCEKIKINFPKSLYYIGRKAFYNTIITNFPDFSHIESLGGSLCAAMPEMTSVHITQKTDQLIQSFLENSNIEEISFEDGDFNLENILHLEDYVFSNTKLKEVKLPVRPMMLYIQTFYDDDSIERIVFSDPEGRTMKTNSHTHSYNHLIGNCPNLREIVCMSPTPPEFAGSSWADFKPISYVHIMDDYSHTVLKVPAGSEKLYADHPVWGRFEHIADMDGNLYKTTNLEIANTETTKTTRFISDGVSPLRLTVDTSSIVTVYSSNGAEICRERIDAGEFSRTLLPGIYIVRIGE